MNVRIACLHRRPILGYITIIKQCWNFLHHGRYPFIVSQSQHIYRLLSSNTDTTVDSTISYYQQPSTNHHHHNNNNNPTTTFDSGPLHDRYYELISPETIDPIQIRTLQSLERLRYELLQNPPSTSSPNDTLTSQSLSSSIMNHSITKLTNWLGIPSSSTRQHQQQQYVGPPPKVQGVYIHGGVGCGKTFLMNEIFYNSFDDTSMWSQHRQKIHFHTFMLQVHQQMHMARKEIQQQHNTMNDITNHHHHNHHHHHDTTNHGGDAILDMVVSNIVQKGRLICFDEFQVTDVADALLLQRLFTSLWKYPNHCIVVATSNRAPDDLYLHGLQRDRFVPFIQQLKVYCQSVGMWESEQDYRLVLKQHDENDDNFSTDATMDNNINTASDHTPNSLVDHEQKMTRSQTTIGRRVYFVGGKEVWKNYDRFFYRLVGKNKAISPTTLQTQGRMVYIPQASLSKGICRFTFESLCTKALGAADYLVLGQHFHTVFVDYIPILKLEHINWVRRFIIFVDTMYECNCKLILHAKTEPKNIFQTGMSEEEIATTQIDEVFAFQRTVSRLHEMSSQTYLQKQQKLHPITIDEDDADSTKRVESKASLLSHRKAFVNYSPS